MASREQYTITGNSIEELKTTLNFILQRLADRLDKLEGIRGTTDFVGSGMTVTGAVSVNDSDDELIHSME